MERYQPPTKAAEYTPNPMKTVDIEVPENFGELLDAAIARIAEEAGT